MSTEELTKSESRWDELGLARATKLAPRPTKLQETGLSETFLADLTTKHLFDKGAMSLGDLSTALGLAGSIVESILSFLRTEARVEVRPTRTSQSNLSYALTDRGRSSAMDAMMRSGYIGPAPVPLHRYADVARAQTIHQRSVTQDAMQFAFDDVILDADMLDRIGPALNSGRAIFLYGQAGTGKTYVSQRFGRLFCQPTLVPYAIAVDEHVIQVFDPLSHKVVRELSGPEMRLTEGHDPRFVVCERPMVTTGGELTDEMLEVRYDASTRLYEAPLQLKANNGVFVIDDMGRQKVRPERILNRWIVPMEEKTDHLTMASGRHFRVPFDVVLVFSTNIHPLELADEAFLRRIGYKIRFRPMSPPQYERVWRDACRDYKIDYDPGILNYVINELHTKKRVPLLPCYPRDLLGMAIDRSVYSGEVPSVSIDYLRWAWDNYFATVDEQEPHPGRATH